MKLNDFQRVRPWLDKYFVKSRFLRGGAIMRQVFLLVFGFLITCSSIAGCGSSTDTIDLGAIDPNEEMGVEEETIKPVNASASEV